MTTYWTAENATYPRCDGRLYWKKQKKQQKIKHVLTQGNVQCLYFQPLPSRVAWHEKKQKKLTRTIRPSSAVDPVPRTRSKNLKNSCSRFFKRFSFFCVAPSSLCRRLEPVATPNWWAREDVDYQLIFLTLISDCLHWRRRRRARR